MKIAVLGGSFNPIHIGHLALADQVCTALGYDKVIFVPAYQPPHKDMNCAISSEDRLQMVRIAVQEDSRFMAEDCELKRKGVSYTWDTVCFLEEKYSGVLDAKIGLIMGDDLLPGFHLWHKAEELAEKCQLILAVRPEDNAGESYLNRAKGEYAEVNTSSYRYKEDPLMKNAVRLPNIPVPLSSSQIREACAGHQGFKYLVPYGVFNYIMERHLYEL